MRIKKNHSFPVSVLVAAFISALLLSLLCAMFYNMWKYETERITLEEGGWQSRIAGDFAPEEIEIIKSYATVKDVAVNEKEHAVDLYFDPMRAVLKDTPRIAGLVGRPMENVSYHHELLAMYLIRDPEDPAPRLAFPFLLLIMVTASLSLIVIIHNAFAVSMYAKLHQIGIFSSVGATPGQIRLWLLREAAVLCAAPILAGNLLGIWMSRILLHMTNRLLGSAAPGRHESVFGYHPLVLALTLLVTVATVWISAWLPAGKLSRMTPLEAIKNTGELTLKRRNSPRVLAFLFGLEGELAGNALKAQRKALRMTSLSFICSFMAFTLMQCFFTMSGISTRETYFEKYLNVWDVMVTVKDEKIDSFEDTARIQELPGVKEAVVYQKAMAERMVAEDEISEEMRSFGGFAHAARSQAVKTDQGWLINAPIVILDDTSFLAYCEQAGAAPRLDGAIIRNQIRDVTSPDFRHPKYMPYIKDTDTVSLLRQAGNEEVTAEIPVLSYTAEVPALREEYASLDPYELVHFVPVSLWKEIKGQIGGIEKDIYIRILGREHETLEALRVLQDEVTGLLGRTHALESENRIQEKETNDRQIQGMMAVFGGFCVLLALIGVGNVFSNTLGFVYQRKREFARYMSVGLTPKELGKMFCIEALVIAGRPVLITLPLAVAVVGYLLRLSYLEAEVFLAEAPFLPIVIFMLAIWGFVALAYYLGWRNVRKISLADALKDDTMM